MVFGKLLFDAAGVAALAYMTCGPAAQVVMEHRRAPIAMTAEARIDRPESLAIDSDKATALPIRRADDGLFYVWCDVNGIPVRFMIDTGASVIVLTPEDARRANVVTSPAQASGQIETAAGVSKMRWARLDRINVAGRELHDLDAAVVAKGLRVSLLGQNLLSRIEAVSIAGNQLQLR